MGLPTSRGLKTSHLPERVSDDTHAIVRLKLPRLWSRPLVGKWVAFSLRRAKAGAAKRLVFHNSGRNPRRWNRRGEHFLGESFVRRSAQRGRGMKEAAN